MRERREGCTKRYECAKSGREGVIGGEFFERQSKRIQRDQTLKRTKRDENRSERDELSNRHDHLSTFVDGCGGGGNRIVM